MSQSCSTLSKNLLISTISHLRYEIDNNRAENAIGNVTISQKNELFSS
ncbi:transposase [Photorhabdus sp. RM323S]